MTMKPLTTPKLPIVDSRQVLKIASGSKSGEQASADVKQRIEAIGVFQDVIMCVTGAWLKLILDFH